MTDKNFLAKREEASLNIFIYYFLDKKFENFQFEKYNVFRIYGIKDIFFHTIDNF
jgi:hypothetical protein